MSHSKWRKFGRSYTLERRGKSEKYINTCAVCGSRGYDPNVDTENFARSLDETRYRELIRILPPLALDALGRCEDCARLEAGREKPSEE
ncbi:MAG: hypothetical protein J6Y74_01070 [Clostridia bacterium]|nr:hypothetical protein [Clostridia bacterium]